ncbi:hypothetical protein J0S82_018183 [Galemys pyrenaicus]|uniref:Uncharacterized protein n=1 Tax=Galemys pyrenaicus TaxID=202257 RepID=A0A8J6AE68_GALPY|nr:hypothetical protein J0S82_018183 [Galemys pyrenaicus]
MGFFSFLLFQDLDDMDADILDLQKSAPGSSKRAAKGSGKEELPSSPRPAGMSVRKWCRKGHLALETLWGRGGSPSSIPKSSPAPPGEAVASNRRMLWRERLPNPFSVESGFGRPSAGTDHNHDLVFPLLPAGGAVPTKPSPPFGHQYRKFSFEGTVGLLAGPPSFPSGTAG